MHFPAIRLVRPLGLAALAGCASETVIEGTDRGAFLPALRASLRLEDPRPAEKDGNGGLGSAGTFLDLVVLRGAGRDAQHLANGEQIEFGDAVFAGPADVSSDFEVVMAEACLRSAVQVDRHAVFFVLAGLGLCRTDVELSSGATRADEVDHAFNALLGGGLAVPLTDRFEIEGRIAGTLLPIDHAQFWEASAGLRVRASAHAGLFAGWRQIGYERTRSGSDLDLTLSGPTVAFELGF